MVRIYVWNFGEEKGDLKIKYNAEENKEDIVNEDFGNIKEPEK